MPKCEGVDVSGEVAGFDFKIYDRVQDLTVGESNYSVTFNRSLFMADEEYKRAGSNLHVTTTEVPFKADSPEALQAALEASRQLPTDQILRNTILAAETEITKQEDTVSREIVRGNLRRRLGVIVTETVVSGAGAATAMIGTAEAVREHSNGWAGIAFFGAATAVGGFVNLSDRLKNTLNDTTYDARRSIWDVHRRRHMIQLAKHATEPVKPEQSSFKLG